MTCRFVLCRGTIAGPGKRSIGGPLSFKRAPYRIRPSAPLAASGACQGRGRDSFRSVTRTGSRNHYGVPSCKGDHPPDGADSLYTAWPSSSNPLRTKAFFSSTRRLATFATSVVAMTARTSGCPRSH